MRRAIVGVMFTLVACAPLLAFDDLQGPLLTDGGGGDDARTDGPSTKRDTGSPNPSDANADGSDASTLPPYDGGDLCQLAPKDGFYCGDSLREGIAPSTLFYCENKETAPDAAFHCAVECIRMPPDHGDLCSRCADLGDGTYCPTEVKAVYTGPEDVVIICQTGAKAITKSCPSGTCVRAAPASHCP